MILHPTPLPGLVVIETPSVVDERGRFTRIFCEQALAPLRPDLHFTQANLSLTHGRGSVRGMHFQHPPMAEAKLVRCVRGRVFDVAVDLRAGSPTFLHWHAVELDAASSRQVFIPEGFAHGFQSLEDDAELLYLHTQPWSRAHEGRVRHDDPRVAIRWPLPPARLSDADRDAPLLADDFTGVKA